MAYVDQFIRRLEHGARNEPRSLQKTIGPSELGEDCYHCLGAKLAGLSQTKDDTYVWASIKGQALHAHMEDMLRDWNAELGEERFLIERKVHVGNVADKPITGHLDCFDTYTGTVIDWKFPGDYTMRQVARGNVKATYRAQPHLYGKGLDDEGIQVNATVIVFLPVSSSKLSDTIQVSAPYDRATAELALKRANDIYGLIQREGAVNMVPRLKRKPDCFDCPRFAL